jgi:hypothetical protein
MYKSLKDGQESDMNEEKIRLLEALRFQWDAMRPRRKGESSAVSVTPDDVPSLPYTFSYPQELIV